MIHNIVERQFQHIPAPRQTVPIDWAAIRPSLLLFADEHDLGIRELQCLVGAAHGMTNPMIARELSVTVDTVKTFLARLFRKIEVNDRAQAVHWAWQNGLFVREAA